MNKRECQICHEVNHETVNCLRIDKSLYKLKTEELVIRYAIITEISRGAEENLKEKEGKLKVANEVLEEYKKTIERLEQQKEERIIRDKNYSAEIANDRFICYYCLKKLSCREMLACILNDGGGGMLLCNLCLKLG